ncbi:nucleotide sugar dehydrogenase [Devosia sp. ZB163]|uniref:nucleotide sugar dehydrogenase n=1 Tax=Devosia sp. ZB163 TaxID=3025938 RepID=UPI00235E4898|nr:nucleotide sugar dehydrogenase [Devosia sp. ZB163]MDC9824273.1 nucleotide sugar dehydrogenase [Devosia sp. ZB163]
MAKISVFGIGYVGVVSAACLADDGHEVIAVDLDPAKVDAVNAGLSPIVENGLDEIIARAVASGRLRATTDGQQAVLDTDASFVCVGTPSDETGAVGLKYVKGVCADIGQAIRHKQSFHSVIIRSTIVPGTMDETCIPVLEEASGMVAGQGFGVGYYPEFLRESTAIADYYDPGLIVFGALEDRTAQILKDINAEMPVPSHVVTLKTAEAVKYASNSWRAVKVTFANEIGNIAKASGVDGQQVMKLICADTKVNISPYFMKPGFAFGGSCLPKDVRALQHLAAKKGVSSPLLDSVLVANAAQIDRAETMVANSGAKSVGLVGIAFKPGTDDLRESPLAELASRLISKGLELRVYDPYVSQAVAGGVSAMGRGNDVVPDLPARLVGRIEDLISSSDVILVGNRYEETIAPLNAVSEYRSLVDLTRINASLRSNGTYEGICW